MVKNQLDLFSCRKMQGEVYTPSSFTSVGEITGSELRFITYLKGVETFHVVLPEQNS